MYKFMGIAIGVIIMGLGAFLVLDALDMIPVSIINLEKETPKDAKAPVKTANETSAMVTLPSKLVGYNTLYALAAIVALGLLFTGFVMWDPFNMFF